MSAQRERLAYEAARILLDQGPDDFDRARRKAAERIGVPDRRQWPSNEDVRDAMLVHRRLFLGQADRDEVQRLRAAALQAMKTLAHFSPRLVGAALTGALGANSGIELFLFADRAEDVIFTLVDLKIPWRETERILRYRGGIRRAQPVLSFLAGGVPIDLIVLPPRDLRDPPLDRVTDLPERGADHRELSRLLCVDGTSR